MENSTTTDSGLHQKIRTDTVTFKKDVQEVHPDREDESSEASEASEASEVISPEIEKDQEKAEIDAEDQEKRQSDADQDETPIEEQNALSASAPDPVNQYRHSLEDLTDLQLIDVVTDLEIDFHHQNLENQIFREYLQYYDPSLLESFEDLLAFALGKGPPPPDLLAEYARRRSGVLGSMSLMSMLDSRGPKVNVSQKIDMAIRATEEIQTKLEAFLDKSQKVRTRLRAELEEFRIRENDIREARDIFEFNIVTQGVDKLTQRIPAEKFVRYMEDWLKTAAANLEKLRLRTASLKVHYKKVSQTLVQRQELGENVHAVDFDQLEIENKHFLEKIEQKNMHFIELKKMNGSANLVLSKHKKYLQSQQQEYNSLKAKIGEHEKLMAEIQWECDGVAKEAERANERLEYIKKLKSSYTVPDVMEYIKLKRELNECRKNVKVWQRRKKIQDITLNACTRQMKNITGSSKIDPMWFVNPGLDEGGEVTEEDEDERELDDEEKSS